MTQERLGGKDKSSPNALDALSSLSQTSAAVWHDVPEGLVDNGNRFFLFEEHAVSWVDCERTPCISIAPRFAADGHRLQ